jgi:glutamate-5-semialdehyde dehydrogenase
MDLPLKFDLPTTIDRARAASLVLAQASSQARNHALKLVVAKLREYHNALLEANTLDLEMSRELAVPDIVLNWLKLTPERLNNVAVLLEQLANLSDPLISRRSSASSVTAQSYAQSVPLGLIGCIYEALPELALILAGMSLKTGNCLLIQGGREASHSNQVIAELLLASLAKSELPEACVQALPSDRVLSQSLITQESGLDLIIPYGRPPLVQQVVREARMSVLRSALGNCYLYWSETGSSDLARTMILESHQGAPDAVNAIEKVLVSPNINASRLTLLWNKLREQGFELKGNAELVAEFPDLALATKQEWDQPYLQKTVAFKPVEQLSEAIAWINAHSSGHADCLVTDSYQESQLFVRSVNSAALYINASPRFSRQCSGPGGTAALGMGGRGGFKPGVISLDTFITSKQIVQGEG